MVKMGHFFSSKREAELDLEAGREYLTCGNKETSPCLNSFSRENLSLDNYPSVVGCESETSLVKSFVKLGFSELPLEKKPRVEKSKKSCRNASKPPRPPKGPVLLGEADRKLVREITELAIRKRARIERMKAIKKAKSEKGSPLYTNLFATIFTVVFFVIVIFQGNFSRNIASVGSSEAPAPAVAAATNEGFISPHVYNIERDYPPSNPVSYTIKSVSGADTNAGKFEEILKMMGKISV